MKSLLTYKINPVVMTAYMVMMMVTEFLLINGDRWWEPLVTVPFNIVFYLSVSWLMCLLASLGGKRYERFIHIVFHALVFIYAVSNVFLFVFFHRHWDAFTLQFLRETNVRETVDFIKGFLLNIRVLVVLLPAVLFLVAEYLLARRVRRIQVLPARRWERWVVYGVLVLLSCNIFYFSTDYDRNYDVIAEYPSPIKRNNVWVFYQSVLQYKHFQKEYDVCESRLRGYSERVQCSEKDADVVLIIGESFNRHYSNLYDGRWNTNPCLSRLRDTGRLYVFNDVIASDNGTSQNFKYIFSMNGVRDSGTWCDVPLLPTVVRRCGYNVVFYGNQFVVNDALGKFDSSMGFLNHPYIAMNLFDARNTSTYHYDMGLVDDYAAKRSSMERGTRNFCIFHLYGQHMIAESRYPSEFAKFTADNIGCRDKSMRQREDIAHYLNATLYNDYVVSKIIGLFENRNAVVIYLSDHGEEVHDFRDQYGRTSLEADVREAMRPQLDVPFMIYVTPSYARLHSGTLARMSGAVDRRFMTDDVAQVVCDILGVRSRYVKSERSVINSAYVEPKHRKLQIGRYYD